MTAPAWCFLVVAGLLAGTGWLASWRRWRVVVVIARPAAMASLAGVAMWMLDVDPAARAFVTAGVILGGVGDLLLALPRHYFASGSSLFMAARVLYGAGFVAQGVDYGAAVLVLTVALFSLLTVGRILMGQIRRLRPGMVPGAIAYMLVTAGVVGLGVATSDPTAGLAVVVLALSDVLLGWNRFVRALSGGHGSIHVVAHTAQALLVMSLVGS
jgi:phosphoglycerol transferase MdoB-like AlkP superfamily enzyme